MHNLRKIKIYRALLWITYFPSWLLVYPFVLLKKRNPSHLFFVFDRYAIGGAQRIFLDVLKSVEDVHKQIYFTRLSKDETLKHSFFSTPHAEVKDIHTWCDNLFLRLFSVHYYAFYFNRHKQAHVFSSNSTFFFDMLPFLSKHITTSELFHNFAHNSNGMEFFGLANHRYITHRIIYDNFTLSNIRKQYAQYGVHEVYLGRIRFIEPGVTIPPAPVKDFSKPLKVLYAGRGGAQKRVWIISKIVERCAQENLPIRFSFAGTMSEDLSPAAIQHSSLLGEIRSESEMYQVYTTHHVLLLTSLFEGFPMVIKEGMACGCVPVVTALEGNKMHLTNGSNALLIDNITDEEYVAAETQKQLQRLSTNENMLQQLSLNAYHYASTHFTREKFLKEMRELLVGSSK
jgi:glycosyltransferase involved in cell wall biosynthesis